MSSFLHGCGLYDFLHFDNLLNLHFFFDDLLHLIYINSSTTTANKEHPFMMMHLGQVSWGGKMNFLPQPPKQVSLAPSAPKEYLLAGRRPGEVTMAATITAQFRVRAHRRDSPGTLIWLFGCHEAETKRSQRANLALWVLTEKILGVARGFRGSCRQLLGFFIVVTPKDLPRRRLTKWFEAPKTLGYF